MLCEIAIKHNLTHRCGKCMPCRIDRREEWSARMHFEAQTHDHSCFTTLTYDEEHLPDDLSISKRDAQLFLKRLRKQLASDEGRSFRYFLCGEYGDQFGRPHYHAILFGLSVLDGQKIHDSWQNGITQTAEITPARIRYTASYVQKKLLGRDTEFREDGRRNEFSLMSRNPGLGHDFMLSMATALARVANRGTDASVGKLNINGKMYPIDRYGRNLLISQLVRLGVDAHKAESMVTPGYCAEDIKRPHTPRKTLADEKLAKQTRFIKQKANRAKALRAGKL